MKKQLLLAVCVLFALFTIACDSPKEVPTDTPATMETKPVDEPAAEEPEDTMNDIDEPGVVEPEAAVEEEPAEEEAVVEEEAIEDDVVVDDAPAEDDVEADGDTE